MSKEERERERASALFSAHTHTREREREEERAMISTSWGPIETQKTRPGAFLAVCRLDVNYIVDLALHVTLCIISILGSS